MPEETLEIRAVVKGWVQGVGFRFFAERSAEKTGVHGWVKNLPDGNVETLAQGSKSQLENYITKLWEGPRSAQITDVEVHWQKPTRLYDSFFITY